MTANPPSFILSERAGFVDPDTLADLAVNAMLAELRLYPKPGLVSPVDSGAHRDMDFVLMEKSAHSLRPHLRKIALAGRDDATFSGTLVPLGQEAEKDMLIATGGVNTHRGAIFVLGLLVAAAAGCGPDCSAEAIRLRLLRRYSEDLRYHLAQGRESHSHGAIVWRQTSQAGVRAEAAEGFPAIFDVALPAYQVLRSQGIAMEAAAMETLYRLIATVHDTNLYYRGGVSGARFAQRVSRRFVASGACRSATWKPLAIRIHHAFCRRNLSPGGCADLLAATLFLDSLKRLN